MGAAMVVIPLAALVLPIALILAAVLVDIAAVFWALYHLWHDKRPIPVHAGPIRHPVSPLRRILHGAVRHAH